MRPRNCFSFGATIALSGLAFLLGAAPAHASLTRIYVEAKETEEGWTLTGPHYTARLDRAGHLRQVFVEGTTDVLEEKIDGSVGVYFFYKGAPAPLRVSKINDAEWVAEGEGCRVKYRFGAQTVGMEISQSIADDLPFLIALNEKTPMAMAPGKDTRWRRAPIGEKTDAASFKYDTFQLAVKGVTSFWPSGNGIQMCECATKKGRSQLIEIELDLYAIKSSGSIFSVTAFPSTTQGVYAKDETPGIFVNVKNHREKDTRLVLKGETVAFNPKNAHHDQVTTEVLVAGNSTGSFLLELPRQKPGFYTFDFTFTAREGEAEAEKEPLASVPFSVAFGSEIHAIPDSEAPTPPKDLREFWDTTLAKLARVDPAYTKTPVPGRTTDRLKAFRVSFTTFGEKRYEAWFTVPFDAAQPNKRYPAILIFPGYGDAPYPFPSEFLLEPILRKYVVMGLRINAKPVDEPTPQHMGYIQSGIASRETFIYRDIYSATVRAFRYLRSSDSVTSSEIFTVGGSQGGGLALAAAALNREAAGCISMAPFLCDFPGAVRPDAIWPYDQVLEYLTKNPQDRERVFQTLSYYDVANLGAWVKCPTLFFIGVQDKICPPETTIKAYHRIPGPKTLGVYAMVGHAFPERFYIDMMDFLISVLKKPGA